MQRTSSRHITACKISNAQPNEMIVSWSGDNIYSFDLIKDPDATENESRNNSSQLEDRFSGKAKESSERKRKRKNEILSSSMNEEGRRAEPISSSNLRAHPGMSLRTQEHNRQSEGNSTPEQVGSISQSGTEETALNDYSKNTLRIARNVAKIQTLMFSFDGYSRELLATGSSDYRAYTDTFTSIFGLAATYIIEMDDIIRSWTYPLNPGEELIAIQKVLRRNRNFSRRFVQAAGTLAKVLGGKLRTVDRGPSHLMHNFEQISSAPEADGHISQTQIFNFEFLRAILLWLQGGEAALLQGFKRPQNRRPGNPTFTVPNEAGLDGIDVHIIPYLLQLAQDDPIINIDSSRFEIDKNRKIFDKETVAVIEFGRVIKTPLEDLSGDVSASSDDVESRLPGSYKQEMVNYWGFKIGRSLLRKAGEDLSVQLVDKAFGGHGRDYPNENRLQDDIDADEMDGVNETNDSLMPSSVENKRMRSSVLPNIGDRETSNSGTKSHEHGAGIDHPSSTTDGEVELTEDLHRGDAERVSEDEDEDEDEDESEGEVEDEDEDEYEYEVDEVEDEEEEEGEEEEEEEQYDARLLTRRLFFRAASSRRRMCTSVGKDVPCSSHHKSYGGHSNFRTVKDVNYFGQQDEFVVSGSDCGHVFIWDKKTSELVNILRGDKEVVNVVQGMPLLGSETATAPRLVLQYDQVTHMSLSWLCQASTIR